MSQIANIASQYQSDLDDIIERLEEIIDVAGPEFGFKAVSDKVQEAIGSIYNAAEAAGRYANGALVPNE